MMWWTILVMYLHSRARSTLSLVEVLELCWRPLHDPACLGLTCMWQLLREGVLCWDDVLGVVYLTR